MKFDYEILTRGDIGSARAELPRPKAEEIGLMPRECWELLRTTPEAHDDIPVAVSAFADGRRMSSAALVPHPVVCRGKEFACLWDYSLYSLPQAQGLGLGGLMLRRLLKVLKARNLTLAGYGSTPQADALYRALGMTHVGQAPRFVLPLSVGPIVRRHLANRSMTDLMRWLPDLALRVRSRLLLLPLRSAVRGFSVLERNEFEESSVPAHASGDGRVHLKRTAAWLNWKIRYARAIDGAEIKVFVVSERKGRPVAEFVARIAKHGTLGSQGFRDVRLFRVLDFCASDSEAVAPALFFLIGSAISSGCDFVEIITTDRGVGALCRRTGFIRSNGYDLYLGAGAELARIPIDDWSLTMLPAEAAFY